MEVRVHEELTPREDMCTPYTNGKWVSVGNQQGPGRAPQELWASQEADWPSSRQGGSLHALLWLCCSSTCVPFPILSFRQTAPGAPRPTSRATSEAGLSPGAGRLPDKFLHAHASTQLTATVSPLHMSSGNTDVIS